MLNILVALDGSTHATSALELASDIASKYGATLHVLSAIEQSDLPESLRQFAEAENIEGSDLRVYQMIAERIVKDASARAKAIGVKAVKTTVRNGDAAKAIVSYAKDNDVDMIVMGSRGLSDLEGLLMGSVSHTVNHLAPCTCVTVR